MPEQPILYRPSSGRRKMIEEIQIALRKQTGENWTQGKVIDQALTELHASLYPDPSGTRGLWSDLKEQLTKPE